jgi:PKD repeat protein
MGSNILTSCIVNCKFNGNTSTINWTGTLQSLESDTITFSAIVLPSGSHGIEFTTNQPNGQSDSRTSNDTLKKTIIVNNYMVSSAFSASVTDFCAAPATVQFTNQSQHAADYLWDFGDGTSSTNENPTHTFNGLGEFTVTLTANAGVCGNAIHFENDYITVGADMPQTTSAALCNNGSTTLYASGNGVLKWFDAVSWGTQINTGPSYTTPVLSATTTYYVQNELASPVQYLGPTNDTTNGGNLNYEHYLVFDCYTPTKLISVEVNATGSKNRTIALRNSSGATIKDTTINISAGRHRITLNFNIPVGNNLRLVGVGSPDLFRTNVASALSYPYEIGGVLSVKESSASQNPTGYYYYFYGWEVQPESCISAREPVTAYVHFNAPDAGFAYSANGLQLSFTDQSVNAVSYQWSFGDGNSSQLANPVNNYSTAGTYNVKQVVNNACGTDSSIVSVQVTPSGISENILSGNINIYPNPVTDKILNIVIDQDVNSLSVMIYDILGNLVDIIWNSAKDNHSPKHLEYNTAKLNAGIYYIVFRNDSDKIVKKLIITD